MIHIMMLSDMWLVKLFLLSFFFIWTNVARGEAISVLAGSNAGVAELVVVLGAIHWDIYDRTVDESHNVEASVANSGVGV